MSGENKTGENNAVLFGQLKDAVFSYDADKANKIVEAIIEQKIDPIHVMHHGVADIATVLGEKFENGEIFIPHLVLGGDILADVSTMLVSSMSEDQSKSMGDKVVVIGTVESDIHSIGKNIVAMLLKANGFQVHDLGVDVKSEIFVQQAEAHGADIIALSSLLTTTMPYQQEVIEDLERLNLRQQFSVLIGGGPITRGWADKIGADGYAKDAVDAIKVANELCR